MGISSVEKRQLCKSVRHVDVVCSVSEGESGGGFGCGICGGLVRIEEEVRFHFVSSHGASAFSIDGFDCGVVLILEAHNER